MGITNSNEKNFEDKLGEKTGMDLDQGGKSGFWTESNKRKGIQTNFYLLVYCTFDYRNLSNFIFKGFL